MIGSLRRWRRERRMVLFDSKRRGAGRAPGGDTARSTSPAYAGWTRLVLRFRRLVLAVWLVALVGGVLASLVLPGRLANSLAVPGSEAERAEAILARDFGERPDGTFTVVFRVRHATDHGLQTRLGRGSTGQRTSCRAATPDH